MMKLVFKVRSGNRILGSIIQHGAQYGGQAVYSWAATASFSDKDSGITDSMEKAKNLIAKSCGMSPRQYHIEIT